MKKHRIGLIGTGAVAGYKHLPEIMSCPDLELVALCDINQDALLKTSEKYGINKEFCFNDYRDLLACPQVDAVDITTPNDVHFEIAMASVAAGKPFSLEKPVTVDAIQSAKLKDATNKAKLPNMVCFSYRYKTAARYARDILARELLGDIYHVNMQYFQSWGNPDLNVPLAWRFQKKRTGSGTMGDLGTHALDLVRFVTSKDYTAVCGHTGTIVKSRRLPDGEGCGPVDVDDFSNYMADMEDGISASFQITRFAFGRGNYQRLEIYGRKGALIYKLGEDRGNDSIEVCIGEPQRETNIFSVLPVPDRFKVDQLQSFADILNKCGDGLSATIDDGHRVQQVTDAILDSAEQRKWISV